MALLVILFVVFPLLAISTIHVGFVLTGIGVLLIMIGAAAALMSEKDTATKWTIFICMFLVGLMFTLIGATTDTHLYDYVHF